MSGSGSGLEKIMDPDPVCPERLDPVFPERLDPVFPERLDPDPVNIRFDPKPCKTPKDIFFKESATASAASRFINVLKECLLKTEKYQSYTQKAFPVFFYGLHPCR